MKNSHKKAKRSNLLLAAEMIYIGHNLGMSERIEHDGRKIYCSRWCCNALRNLLGYDTKNAELELLSAYFYQRQPNWVRGGGWWEMDACEERILALLLCAEMLRR